MRNALLQFPIMGRMASAFRLRAFPILLAALVGACTSVEDEDFRDPKPCGTSCGGGNPPSFRFDAPFTGTAELFAATQNPVMDAVPFLSLELAGVDSFRLEKSDLDSILRTDRLDTVLKYTLSDSGWKRHPEAQLEFNMVFRSGDSAWLIPGISYWKGGLDSDQVFQVAALAPLDTFRGKVALPPDDVNTISNPPQDHLYFAGTPFQSRIGFDSSFVLNAFPSESPVLPRIFRYREKAQSGSKHSHQITLLQSKSPLSEDSAQVLTFDILVDSIPTSWMP